MENTLATPVTNKQRKLANVAEYTANICVIFSLGIFTSCLFYFFSREYLLEFAVILVFFSFLLVSISASILVTKLKELRALDIILVAIFAALIFSTNYFSMLIPSFLYSIIPFAAGLSFYFPAAVTYGAFRYLSQQRSSSFFLMLVYGLVSEIFWPNIFWFPYYLAWGAAIELSRTKDISIIEGFAFGFSGSSLALDYMLIGWGYYVPIFIVIPSIIGDGLLSMFGFYIGRKIGEELSSVLGR